MPTLQLLDQPRPLLAYLDPVAMVRSLWSHRELTWQYARRKVQSNYKGQALGGVWTVLDPLLTLAVYTFIFGIVFSNRGDIYGDMGGGIAFYALRVFAGILTFGLFRQMVGQAPSLIISQRNMVKKVVYPLETFPVSQLLVVLFNFAVGVLVWIIAYCIFDPTHVPRVSLLLLPVVVLPVVLLGLGMSWLLSSLGVFLRDLKTPVGSILHIMFFMSAIFYPIEAVPEKYQVLIEINPFAQAVTAARAVMFGNEAVRWDLWAITLAGGVALCLFGYAFFMKSRRAFADVI